MLPGSIPGLFHDVEVDSDTDIAKDSEELKRQLGQIGGWWGVVSKRWVEASEKPGHALQELKRALMEDTISYGVVSAVMLTIAQAEMCLEDREEAPVFLRVVKQVHVNCWYACFAANMLCLYLSTTEYLHTTATHPKDILTLLAKRYPLDFGKPPECNINSWLRFLKVGKLDAFKRGFQTMVPGLCSGVYLRCDWPLTVGPVVISLLTCLLGWAMWKTEMKMAPRRPPPRRRPDDKGEAFLEPWRNSRELHFYTGGAHPDAHSSLPPSRNRESPSERFARLPSSPSSSRCGDDRLSPRGSHRSSRSSRSGGSTSPRISPHRRSNRGRQEVAATSSACCSAPSSASRASRKRSSGRRRRRWYDDHEDDRPGVSAGRRPSVDSRASRDSRGSVGSRDSRGSRGPSVDYRDGRSGAAGRRHSHSEERRDGDRVTGHRPSCSEERHAESGRFAPPPLAPPPKPAFPQHLQQVPSSNSSGSRRMYAQDSPGQTFTYRG